MCEVCAIILATLLCYQFERAESGRKNVAVGSSYQWGTGVTKSAPAISATVPRFVALSAVCLALVGCKTLGPNFALPKETWEKDWQGTALADLPKGAPKTLWWEQFDDPALTALVAAAETGNNNIRTAGLRVLEARAQLDGAGALRLPQLVAGTAGAGYAATQRGGQSLGSSDYLVGSVGVQAGWELDLWGRFRRAVQGAEALWFEREATRQDVLILVRAEAARLYLQHRTLEERIAVIRSNAATQRHSVEITGTLFRQGQASELDLQQARAQLLATEAALPALESALLQTRNVICVLLGRPPSEVPELALSPARLPVFAPEVAVELPADLLRRRPDVRAAALRAAAQSAQIGIAKADFYPALSLGGSIRLGRSTPGIANAVDLQLGPSIRWNILDFGQIRANVRVQDARLEQALVAYRETVLQAAAEVDSNAIAFAKAREENAVVQKSVAAAQRALELAHLLYREGMIDFQRVLDAQSVLLRQQERQVANRGEIAADLVQLYKSLGGGWDAVQSGALVDEETRQRMRARTNWGALLEPVAEQRK
jgi:NodT family efflux transporter outer membrane factor (OMF) lipoprotein